MYLIPQWTSPYFALKVALAAHGLHPALSQFGITPSGLCDFEILLRVFKSTQDPHARFLTHTDLQFNRVVSCVQVQITDNIHTYQRPVACLPTSTTISSLKMYTSNLANKYQLFLWNLIFNHNTRLLQPCIKVGVMSEGYYNIVTTLQPCHKSCYNLVICTWVIVTV